MVAKWYCSSYGTWRCHMTKMIFSHFAPKARSAMAMMMAPRSLLVVVGPRPLTALQGQPCQLVHGVAQLLVAGEAEPHHHLFPAAHGDGHHPRLCLQMPKRLP